MSFVPARITAVSISYALIKQRSLYYIHLASISMKSQLIHIIFLWIVEQLVGENLVWVGQEIQETLQLLTKVDI